MPIYPSELESAGPLLVPGGAPPDAQVVHGEGQSTARPGMHDKREAQNRATAWAERHFEQSQQGPAAEAEQLRQELDSLQEVAVEALAHKDAQIRAASVAQNKTYEELTVVTRRAKKLEGEMKNAQVLNEELRSKLLELADHYDRCWRARGRH